MDHWDFVDKITPPLYSWRMAEAMVGKESTRPDGTISAAVKSAPRRELEARRRIDDIVLKRAMTILAERREREKQAEQIGIRGLRQALRGTEE